MNTEQLICEAGCAIVEFSRLHDESCVLVVKNHEVICLPSKDVRCNAGTCLYITKWQQKHGLTSNHWTKIGKELFLLYHKEKSCQQTQKHLM